ncbi:hypothetical protein F4804DRAFT_322916 [Jackrogersella minutella]|nr:hypothetical protein F4804DRAFT_322916 [Jackrogersella minutella]
MQPSYSRMGLSPGASLTPAYIDNAKSLSSSMIRPPSRPSRGTSERSGPSSHLTADTEPLLGRPDTPNTRDLAESGGSHGKRTSRKRSCECGVPIIIFCRLFNAMFSVLTINKANKEVGDGWNLWIFKLLFGLCWIILIWNLFALLASIVSRTCFPYSSHEKGEPKKDFRDWLRVRFACSDAALGLVTVVLLVIACQGMNPNWNGRFVGLKPPVVAMVSFLVAFEFLIAMVQPFRYSENMLFSVYSSIGRFEEDSTLD